MCLQALAQLSRFMTDPVMENGAHAFARLDPSFQNAIKVARDVGDNRMHMSGDLWTSLTFAAASYVFWRTYRDPTRDPVTRTLYRYYERYNWPGVRPEVPLLVFSCVGAATAIMFLIFAFQQA